jgi:ubiquitin-conjugating enzyme E2 variant
MSIALTIIVCYIVADFLTGFFHWFEDTWVTPETPIIGESVGFHNVEHHRDPTLMGKMGTWITRNLISVILAVIVLVIFWVFGCFNWQIFLIAFFAAWGNEVHEWNHRVKPKNQFVAFMQDAGLVQSKKQHLQHHKKPYDRYYCVLGNFTNAVLERINFWRNLELVCVKLLRMKIKRLSVERNGY